MTRVPEPNRSKGRGTSALKYHWGALPRSGDEAIGWTGQFHWNVPLPLASALVVSVVPKSQERTEKSEYLPSHCIEPSALLVNFVNSDSSLVTGPPGVL